MNKPNPRRRPATMADVARAKHKATNDAIRLVLTVVIYILKDKFDWSNDRIGRLSRQVNKTVAMIAEGRLTLNDIHTVLGEEYDLVMEVK